MKKILCLLLLCYSVKAYALGSKDVNSGATLHPKLAETKTFSQLGLTTAEARASYLALTPTNYVFFEAYTEGNILNLSPFDFVNQMFDAYSKAEEIYLESFNYSSTFDYASIYVKAKNPKLAAFFDKEDYLSEAWSSKDRGEWYNTVAIARKLAREQEEAQRPKL